MKSDNKGDNPEALNRALSLFLFLTRPWFLWVMPFIFLGTGITFAVMSGDQPMGTRVSYALLGFLGSIVSVAFTGWAATATSLLRDVRATLSANLAVLHDSVRGEFLDATGNICDRVDALETEFTTRLAQIERNIPFSIDGLTPVVSSALLKRMRDLNNLATLLRGGSFRVKQYEMYWILVDFTEGLASNQRIDAIASIAINEFDEIYGRAYLDACTRARDNNGVVTRRLFLIKNKYLESNNLESTLKAVRANVEFLGDQNVKCMYFTEGKRFLQPGLEDFVVFGNDVIFAQSMETQNEGSEERLLELVQEKGRVSPAVGIFNSLWENQKSLSAEEFINQINQKTEDVSH